MAEFTSRDEHSRVELVSDVVAPYGFPRETIDGGDVPALWEAFGGFLDAARAGRGPMLLECLTHRRRGHYEGDAEAYRDPVAEQEWARRDPIQRFEALGLVDDAAARAIAEEAARQVEHAVAFARRSPFPDLSLSGELVYAP